TDLDRRAWFLHEVEPPRGKPVHAPVRGDDDEIVSVAEKAERRGAQPAGLPAARGQEQDRQPPDPRADAAAACPVEPRVHAADDLQAPAEEDPPRTRRRRGHTLIAAGVGHADRQYSRLLGPERPVTAASEDRASGRRTWAGTRVRRRRGAAR